MDLQEFAKSIVKAANKNGNIRILQPTKKDISVGCILRFRLGSL